MSESSFNEFLALLAAYKAEDGHTIFTVHVTTGGVPQKTLTVGGLPKLIVSGIVSPPIIIIVSGTLESVKLITDGMVFPVKII